MPNSEDTAFKQTQERIHERKNNIARTVGEKVLRSAGKYGSKNVLTKKAMGSLLKFAPAIGYILLVILIAFIIIGLIAFFLTMPGIMADKLSSIYDNLEEYRSAFETGVLAKNEDVIEMANYIQGMDYDLVGFGFVQPESFSDYPIAQTFSEQGYNLVMEENTDENSKQKYLLFYEKEDGTRYGDNTSDDKYFYHSNGKLYGSTKSSKPGYEKDSSEEGEFNKYGIIYNQNGEIVSLNDDVSSSILRTYNIAEKRLYVIRNTIKNESLAQRLIGSLKDFCRGYSNAWAQGLLEFWESENGKATGFYDFWTKGSVKISGKNKLECDGGWFNNPMTFSLDGWTGRYGLSTDFLISLHLATLSPELVTSICQTFDTRIQIYLDHIDKNNGSIVSYYHTEEMGDTYVSYDDLIDVVGMAVSNKDAILAMREFGIKSIERGDEKYQCEKPNGKLCSEDKDLKKACTPCEKYIEQIRTGLRKINDEKYETYIPYISRVVGSWFRDTYFIIPKSEDEAIKSVYKEYGDDYGSKGQKLTLGNVKVIQNDNRFLKETGELWTSYVMDEHEYNYALFVINSDGSYLESENELDDWKEKIRNNASVEEREIPEELLNLVGSLTKGNDTYYGYIDVYEGREKEEIDKESAKYIEDLFAEYEISFIKRPIIQEVASNSSLGWSAYEFKQDSSSGRVPLEINQDTPSSIQTVTDLYNNSQDDVTKKENVFYYDFSVTNNMVTQTADAQRGMTNEKIKYLFKNRKYYKYDGSIPKAYEIRDDWVKCKELVKNQIGDNETIIKTAQSQTEKSRIAMHNSVYRSESLWYKGLNIVSLGFASIANTALEEADAGQATEDLLNSYIDDYYYEADYNKLDKYMNGKNLKFVRDFDDDGNADIASPNYKSNIGDTIDGLKISANTKFTYDPRNPNLISKIDLSSDGLAAFSILENTHTADADYAYRDFKELIVELDYFDKEDLTKPATDILEWILPESGSAGWPVKKYDKYNDYGTLIHSKEMYENIDKLFESVQIEEELDDSTEPSETKESTIKTFEGFEKGQAIVSPATAKIIEMGTTTVNNETAEQLFEAMYIVEDEENSENLSDFDETENIEEEENTEDIGESENIEENVADAENTTEIDDSQISFNNENNAQKAFITKSQKELIELESEKLVEDPNCSFGKSYTTGYIKLEVIGSETIAKLCGDPKNNINPVINLPQEALDGLEAFYEDYYSKSQNKTICDSYTIYIEGIDFRKDQTEGASWEFNNTIISDIIKNQNSINLSNKNNSEEEKRILSWTPNTEIGEVTKNIDNYTEKDIPKYYPEAQRDELKEQEEKKKNMPSVIEFKDSNTNQKQIYLKAGTLLGLCGDANIKIIMKDKDYAVVENVEEYLEIETSEQKNKFNSEWEMFFWLPFECMAIGTEGNGVDCQGSCSNGETGVGLVQWTDLTSNGMNNIANQFIPGCLEIDENFCIELKNFENWSAQDFWNDYTGSKLFQKALKTIAKKDREYFTSIQMEVTKKDYLAPVIEVAPWIVDRPECVQGILLHLNAFGTDWSSWINDYQNLPDEDIIFKARQTIATTNSTAGYQTSRAYNETQIALEILAGNVTEDELHDWIWNNDSSVFNFNFK